MWWRIIIASLLWFISAFVGSSILGEVSSKPEIPKNKELPDLLFLVGLSTYANKLETWFESGKGKSYSSGKSAFALLLFLVLVGLPTLAALLVSGKPKPPTWLATILSLSATIILSWIARIVAKSIESDILAGGSNIVKGYQWQHGSRTAPANVRDVALYHGTSLESIASDKANKARFVGVLPALAIPCLFTYGQLTVPWGLAMGFAGLFLAEVIIYVVSKLNNVNEAAHAAPRLDHHTPRPVTRETTKTEMTMIVLVGSLIILLSLGLVAGVIAMIWFYWHFVYSVVIPGASFILLVSLLIWAGIKRHKKIKQMQLKELAEHNDFVRKFRREVEEREAKRKQDACIHEWTYVPNSCEDDQFSVCRRCQATKG